MCTGRAATLLLLPPPPLTFSCFFFCFSLKESDGIHHHRYRRRRHRRSLSLSFRSAPVIRSFKRQETGASKKRRRRNVESSSPNLISFFLSSCLYIKWSVQLVRLYRVDSICILYRLISFLLTAFPRLLGRTREDVHYEKKKRKRREDANKREMAPGTSLDARAGSHFLSVRGQQAKRRQKQFQPTILLVVAV